MNDEEMRKEWYKSFIKTYVERELPLIGLNTTPQNLFRFLTMLSHNHGHLFNASNFAKSLGVSSPTISRFVDFLQSSFLIQRLYPYFTNVKKRLVKSPKIYLRDTGILHHRLNISNSDELLAHPVAGMSWEGYVIEQIMSTLGDDYEYYFYRTQDGTECDLVLTKGNKPLITVEIKLTLQPQKTKSMTLSIQDLKTDKNFIIIPQCNEIFPFNRKSWVCNLEQFFTNVDNPDESVVNVSL